MKPSSIWRPTAVVSVIWGKIIIFPLPVRIQWISLTFADNKFRVPVLKQWWCTKGKPSIGSSRQFHTDIILIISASWLWRLFKPTFASDLQVDQVFLLKTSTESYFLWHWITDKRWILENIKKSFYRIIEGLFHFTLQWIGLRWND